MSSSKPRQMPGQLHIVIHRVIPWYISTVHYSAARSSTRSPDCAPLCRAPLQICLLSAYRISPYHYLGSIRYRSQLSWHRLRDYFASLCKSAQTTLRPIIPRQSSFTGQISFISQFFSTFIHHNGQRKTLFPPNLHRAASFRWSLLTCKWLV